MIYYRSCCTSTNLNRQKKNKKSKRVGDVWVMSEAQLISVVQPVHVRCYKSLTSTSHLLLWNLRLNFRIHLTSTPTSLSVCPWWKRSQNSCALLNYKYKEDSNEKRYVFPIDYDPRTLLWLIGLYTPGRIHKLWISLSFESSCVRYKYQHFTITLYVIFPRIRKIDRQRRAEKY